MALRITWAGHSTRLLELTSGFAPAASGAIT
jgi:hypothetical protein